MGIIPASFLSLILAYLIGSMPLAYLAGRWLKGIDIRQVGDGNVGSANVIREVGVIPGILVGFGDIVKGAVAVLVARALSTPELVPPIAGILAMVGHAWSPFLSFKGGMGEATALGVLLVLLPREILILGGAAGITYLITRSGVITTVVLMAPLPLLAWLFREPFALIIWCLAPGIFVALRRYQQDRALQQQNQPKETKMAGTI